MKTIMNVLICVTSILGTSACAIDAENCCGSAQLVSVRAAFLCS